MKKRTRRAGFSRPALSSIAKNKVSGGDEEGRKSRVALNDGGSQETKHKICIRYCNSSGENIAGRAEERFSLGLSPKGAEEETNASRRKWKRARQWKGLPAAAAPGNLFWMTKKSGYCAD